MVMLQSNVCINEQFENMTALEVKIDETCGVVQLKPKPIFVIVVGSVCGISISVVVGLLLFWKFCYKKRVNAEPSTLNAAKPHTTPSGSAEPATKTSASPLTTPSYVSRAKSQTTSSSAGTSATSASTAQSTSTTTAPSNASATYTSAPSASAQSVTAPSSATPSNVVLLANETSHYPV
jgi:cytoskeletal protein RodZ